MNKTARHVHLPIQEARHCKMRLGTINMGELAQLSQSSAAAITEIYRLLERQLREVDNAK